MVDPAPSPESSSRPDDPSELPRPAPAPPLLDWRERLDDLRSRWAGGSLVAWVVGAVVVAGIAYWLLRPTPTPVEETLPLASTTAASGSGPAPAGGSGSAPAPGATTGSLPAEIVAHAAGAVARPGVYRLDPTARVDDLVRAAGGLAPDADASRLNLAAPLADGTRVYVPRLGEEVPDAVGPDGPPAPPGAGPGGTGPEDGAGGLVNLNTADEARLDELPGVGPATAAAIIAFREENGGFRSVDDLLDVRGIGEAKLEQLRPLVTVG